MGLISKRLEEAIREHRTTGWYYEVHLVGEIHIVKSYKDTLVRDLENEIAKGKTILMQDWQTGEKFEFGDWEFVRIVPVKIVG